MEPSIAVKAIVVHDGKVLVLKRRPTDVHHPGGWDIPGGRLEECEERQVGLAREVFEETRLKVDIGQVLGVQHFVRDDGQNIKMYIFSCTSKGEKVKLSVEHTAFAWLSVDGAKKLLDYYDEEFDRLPRSHHTPR